MAQLWAAKSRKEIVPAVEALTKWLKILIYACKELSVEDDAATAMVAASLSYLIARNVKFHNVSVAKKSCWSLTTDNGMPTFLH